MTFRRHLYAAVAALVAFGVFTMMSDSLGWPALIASAVIAAVITVVYFHYRRRKRVDAIIPVTPARDDRIVPQDVKIAVAIRDKGQCQLRYPGICLGDRELQYDHKYAWSRGGSSKDADNIQLACKPCNAHKGARVLTA